MDQISFAGKVAIVTGAGRGLGRSHAMLLASRGAAVVVNDLGGGTDGQGGSQDVANGVVAEIKAAGGRAVASGHSVADEAQARALVQLAVDEFGTLDIVVNNAGTFGGAPFDEISLKSFRDMVEVHLFGAVNVTHAAWPILKKKHYGRVVNTVSSGGLWGIANSSSYCAAKAGIVGLSRSLAQEGAPLDIKVNMIAPGAKTRATERLFGGKAGHTWRPELISPAVAYLCSEECRYSGAIFAGLAGQFARVEIEQGPGVKFDPRLDVTIEDFVGRLGEIESLEGARAQSDGLSSEIRNTAGPIAAA